MRILVQNGTANINGKADSFAFILLFLAACDGKLDDNEATYIAMEVSNLIDAYDLDEEEDTSFADCVRKAGKNWETCGGNLDDIHKILLFCMDVVKDGFSMSLREDLVSKFRGIITHDGKVEEVEEQYFSVIEDHFLK